jgi:hypothetical protein
MKKKVAGVRNKASWVGPVNSIPMPRWRRRCACSGEKLRRHFGCRSDENPGHQPAQFVCRIRGQAVSVSRRFGALCSLTCRLCRRGARETHGPRSGRATPGSRRSAGQFPEPGGCLTVSGAIASGDEGEPVRQALNVHRTAGVALLRCRFEQARTDSRASAPPFPTRQNLQASVAFPGEAERFPT